MLRILLIFSLVGYVLYKLGLFKIFMHTQVRGQRPTNPFNHPPKNDIHVNSAPKEKKGSGFKGGEYVDYEEVK